MRPLRCATSAVVSRRPSTRVVIASIRVLSCALSARRLMAMFLRWLLTMVMRWLSLPRILAILILSSLTLLSSLLTSRLCFPLACRSDLLTPVTRLLSRATVLLSAPHTRTILVRIILLICDESLAIVRVTFLPIRFDTHLTSLRRRLRRFCARTLASFLCLWRRLTSDCSRLRRPAREPVVLVDSPPTALRTLDASLRPLARSLLTLPLSRLTSLRSFLFLVSTDVRSTSILSCSRCVAATASALDADSCCARAPVRSVLAAATSPSILARSEAMSASRCLVTSRSSLCTFLSSALITLRSLFDALRESFLPALAVASSPDMLRSRLSLFDVSRVPSSWIAVVSESCIVASCSLSVSTLPSTDVDARDSLARMPASTSSTLPPSTSDAFCRPALMSVLTLSWSRRSCSLSFCCAADSDVLASSSALRSDDSCVSVPVLRTCMADLSDDTDWARAACSEAACEASDDDSCCLAAASCVSVWLICADSRKKVFWNASLSFSLLTCIFSIRPLALLLAASDASSMFCTLRRSSVVSADVLPATTPIFFRMWLRSASICRLASPFSPAMAAVTLALSDTSPRSILPLMASKSSCSLCAIVRLASFSSTLARARSPCICATTASSAALSLAVVASMDRSSPICSLLCVISVFLASAIWLPSSDAELAVSVRSSLRRLFIVSRSSASLLRISSLSPSSCCRSANSVSATVSLMCPERALSSRARRALSRAVSEASTPCVCVRSERTDARLASVLAVSDAACDRAALSAALLLALSTACRWL
mmetsp:Transcript_43081/g.107810  ORF Transcript_43081/g.107810 Transcript_43081/m.107810 type:complete len:776 (-) Transcript_43081:1745-4072(-)